MDAKPMEVPLAAASHPEWTSRAECGKQKQGGGVHAMLDREVPGPACLLLRKRRQRGLDRRISFTRAVRSVSDQLSVRGSCTTSCSDVWGAGAGSTSREPSAALVDPR
eukprot:4490598-Amphidinium_carterae.1